MTEQKHAVTADIRLIFTDQVTGRRVRHDCQIAIENPGAVRVEIFDDEPTEIFRADDVIVRRTSTKYLDLRIDRCRLIPGEDGHYHSRVIEEGTQSDQG